MCSKVLHSPPVPQKDFAFRQPPSDIISPTRGTTSCSSRAVASPIARGGRSVSLVEAHVVVRFISFVHGVFRQDPFGDRVEETSFCTARFDYLQPLRNISCQNICHRCFGYFGDHLGLFNLGMWQTIWPLLDKNSASRVLRWRCGAREARFWAISSGITANICLESASGPSRVRCRGCNRGEGVLAAFERHLCQCQPYFLVCTLALGSSLVKRPSVAGSGATQASHHQGCQKHKCSTKWTLVGTKRLTNNFLY